MSGAAFLVAKRAYEESVKSYNKNADDFKEKYGYYPSINKKSKKEFNYDVAAIIAITAVIVIASVSLFICAIIA